MNIFSWSVLVIFLSLVGYGLFSYLRIQGLIRESSILVRSSVPYTQVATPDTPKVLFVGDSTGVGVGATRPGDSVAGRLGAAYPEWNIENRSVSGRKTAEILPTLRDLANEQYDTIVIQVGGNDIVYFSDLKQLEKDIASVLKEAKRVGGEVALLTSGNVGNAPLLPRPLAFLWEQRTLSVRGLFMEAARQAGVTYVDLYRDDENDPFKLEPLRYHAVDLFHPSSDGYALWYESLKKVL
ncbi:MAG: hypothetical protein KBA91_02565 [Candidatus Moranbacteria bacterium]|nr:hypothetical protein [Candidatus Moranbacteria bacterium]